MKYSDFKRKIKIASEQQKKDGLSAYIAYWNESKGSKGILVSNFMDVPDGKSFEDQVFRAFDEGLLEKDWVDFIVV